MFKGSSIKYKNYKYFFYNFKAKNKILMLIEHWLGWENREHLNNLGLDVITGYLRETGKRRLLHPGRKILINKVKISSEYERFAVRNTTQNCVPVADINFHSYLYFVCTESLTKIILMSVYTVRAVA